MISIRTLRELDALEDARGLWTSLQRHPWGDFGYYRSCVAREEGFSRPHVLVAEQGGTPACLVAGSLRDERVSWRVGSVPLLRSRARILRLAANGTLGVAAGASARAISEDLLACLSRGEADALYLHEYDPADPLLLELEGGAGRLQRDPGKRTATGWILDVPPTFEAFRRGLSKKTRTNLNYTMNLVRRRLGDVSVACYRRPEELDRLLRDTDEVARRTYHRHLGVGFVETPAARRMLEHALAAGWLRVHVLYAGARPIAFSHALLYARTFHGRHTAFDPEFADLRPGVYLLARIVEELCADGSADHLDFGVMDNDFKRSFATRSYERTSVYVFAPTARGLRLALGRAAVGGVDRAVRATVDVSSARRILRRISMALRGRAVNGPGAVKE